MSRGSSVPNETGYGAENVPESAQPRQRPTTFDPLSDQELEQLDALLADSNIGTAMRIEELDGFFSGLLAGPLVLKPCHFWPVVLGKTVADPGTLDYIRTTAALLPFFARHWDTIARTLSRDEVHLPYLTVDEFGIERGCDWARGFLRAVELNAEAWNALIGSDDGGAAVLPMMILAHEDDSDPLLRTPPLHSEQRTALIKLMVIGLVRANRHFAPGKTTLTTTAPPPNLH